MNFSMKNMSEEGKILIESGVYSAIGYLGDKSPKNIGSDFFSVEFEIDKELFWNIDVFESYKKHCTICVTDEKTFFSGKILSREAENLFIVDFSAAKIMLEIFDMPVKIDKIEFSLLPDEVKIYTVNY